jgi:hypothetical protein
VAITEYDAVDLGTIEKRAPRSIIAFAATVDVIITSSPASLLFGR